LRAASLTFCDRSPIRFERANQREFPIGAVIEDQHRDHFDIQQFAVRRGAVSGVALECRECRRARLQEGSIRQRKIRFH
jgi:hypothetical protein